MKKTMFMVLLLATCVFGAQPKTPNTELLNYKIEQLQKIIDELKKDVDEAKKSEQGIESLKDRLGDVNNRVSDISGSVDRFGIILSVFLLVGGLVTYISVRAKAKEEAREAAKNETEAWIKKEGDKTLQTIIEKLEKEAQEKIAKAVETAKEEIKEQSKVEELFMKGNSHYYAKEYDKAIEAYQKAIDINSKSDVAYNNLGSAYGKQNKYNEAIIAYTKAISINPKNNDAYNNLGMVYGKQERYDDAIDAYKNAIIINPKKYYAYVNLFELQLIHNIAFSDENKLLEFCHENKEAMMIYEMLKILQGIALNRAYALSKEAWTSKYQGVTGNWGWKEIDTWLRNMPESETKGRLLDAVVFFKEALKA